MAESFADHFAESAARTNALRRSHRELRSTRERAARTRRSLELFEEPPSTAGMHPETLTQMGRGDAEGVTEEDAAETWRLGATAKALFSETRPRDVTGALTGERIAAAVPKVMRGESVRDSLEGGA